MNILYKTYHDYQQQRNYTERERESKEEGGGAWFFRVWSPNPACVECVVPLLRLSRAPLLPPFFTRHNRMPLNPA